MWHIFQEFNLLSFPNSGGLFHSTETLEELVFQYTTQTINSEGMILHKTLVALPKRVPPNDSLVASSIGEVSTEDSVHLPIGGRSRCDRLMCLQCVTFWSSVWSGSLVHEQVPHHPSCSPCVTQRTFPMWRLVGTQSSIARTSW